MGGWPSQEVAKRCGFEGAESAGSMLMAHNITADLRGRLARGGPIELLVDEEHESRALELLGLSEALPEVARGDPLWLALSQGNGRQPTGHRHDPGAP